MPGRWKARTFTAVNLSPEALEHREADLARMRAKFKREQSRQQAKNATRNKVADEPDEPEFLELADLARAVRFAKRRYANERLIAQLELAATYFDDAEKREEEEKRRVLQL